MTNSAAATAHPSRTPSEQRFMLTGAFMHYRALQTAAELELADHLANGSLDVGDLATRSKAHVPSLFRMMRTLESVGVFKQVSPRVFANTPVSELLRRGVPGSQWARDSGIHPIFMGRLEHNDDIDKRIIKEIEACDLAIADLTYARPSVYFEAGYAQRFVPVIYTARKDHHVHFDLLMKNIIPWTSPTDSSFARKLVRRIRKVAAPMLRQRQLDERARAAQLQFQRLSVSSRLQFVSEFFIKALKRSGYRPLVVSDDVDPWLGRIPNTRTLNLCRMSAEARATRTIIREQANRLFQVVRSRFEDLDDRDGYKPSTMAEFLAWPQTSDSGGKECKKSGRPAGSVFIGEHSTDTPRRSTTFIRCRRTWARGQVFTWNGPRHLPATIAIYIVDEINSERDALKKAEELKRWLRAGIK